MDPMIPGLTGPPAANRSSTQTRTTAEPDTNQPSTDVLPAADIENNSGPDTSVNASSTPTIGHEDDGPKFRLPDSLTREDGAAIVAHANLGHNAEVEKGETKKTDVVFEEVGSPEHAKQEEAHLEEAMIADYLISAIAATLALKQV